MPAARSQLVTVRRPLANSAPPTRAAKRPCRRASRVEASSSTQLDNSCGSGQDDMAGPPGTTAWCGNRHRPRGAGIRQPPAIKRLSCESVLGKCSCQSEPDNKAMAGWETLFLGLAALYEIPRDIP